MKYAAIVSRLDPLFIGSIGLLLVVGTAILVSVEPRLFPLQWTYLLGGVLIFWLGTKLDRIILDGITPILYGLVTLALVATLVLGVVTSGAIRWLAIGPLTIQPSEFAKPILILTTAWVFLKKPKHNFFLSLFLAFLISLLVFVQPDFGTTIILVAGWFGAILGSGVSLKTVFKFLGFSVFLLPILWFLLAPYQKERVLSFVSKTDTQGANYQGLQAMISSGSGGFFGRGLGQGSQTQLSFLPEHHTDFAFASIGEELGFFGMMIVIFSFFILFWRIINVLAASRDPFTKGAVSGIFVYLFTQVFINIAMNLGMLPVAGIPLPLMSAGGSALVSTMFALGIVLGLRK